MSKEILSRCLRPHLFHSFKRSQCLHLHHPARVFSASAPCTAKPPKQHDVTHDYERRIAQIEAHTPLSECYPRLIDITARQARVTETSLQKEASHVKEGTTETFGLPIYTPINGEGGHTLLGRVHSIRTAGSKLVFLDVETEDDSIVQAVCNFERIRSIHQEVDKDITIEQFKAFSKLARKGDFYSIIGWPHRTDAGQLCIFSVTIPTLLSPSLHQIPEALEDPEARARNRHVDMLVNPEAIQTLQVRHHVEKAMQEFFNDDGFIKVTTPLLSATAGGAAARPFETVATEMSDDTLQLRIAPELWLKRLVVGGMPRVYEIGPAFRNEGVDNTHNPEFNICEFYESYATLDDLMSKTETLIWKLHRRIQSLREAGHFTALGKPTIKPTYYLLGQEGNVAGDPFPRVEFLPSLEKLLGLTFPDLQSPEAINFVQNIFSAKQIPEPTNPTLPRLLDALAAACLEPLSTSTPIFITHHPACMSPLSKHFTCPKTGQIVAARAELFMGGREYANMYEEENSPFEQRRKFEEQMKERQKDGEAMQLDEQYLRTLEWGLPPTGGWGCGVDRILMWLSGRERMGDVLAFGTLRNVVGLGRVGRR